jgi:predicted transcriptional regulator
MSYGAQAWTCQINSLRRYAETAISMASMHPGTARAFEEGRQNARAILEVIESRPNGARTNEIAEELGFSKKTVYSHCTQMQAQGLITKRTTQSPWRIAA